MKKGRALLVFVLICCIVAGCGEKNQVSQQLPAQEQQSQTELPVDGEVVRNSHGYANMRLTIPDGWEYEITEYSQETGTFGIVFRPEGERVGSLSLMYFDAWALIGTGFEEKMDFIGEREVGIGTYSGQVYWNYIRFRYMPGDYIFYNTGADGWYDQYEDQINSILESAVIAEDIMTYAQAVQTALSWADEQKVGVYEVSRSGFTMDNGVWEIFLAAINNTGPDHTIHIFPDGRICEVDMPLGA